MLLAGYRLPVPGRIILLQTLEEISSIALSWNHESAARVRRGTRRVLSTRPLCDDRSFLDVYKKSFQFPASSHEIRDLASCPIGDTVTLHGYLGPRADLSKGLSFVPLRSKDLRHSVQIISTPRSSWALHSRLKLLGAQDAVAISGVVKERKVDRTNIRETRNISSVEVELRELWLLNKFPEDIIFQEDTNIAPELRHLQIRRDCGIRDALAFRSKVANLCRDELSNKHGFLEVETPLLFKSTPEGAREFLVPTRTRGLAYALPQSPQQYKQILMASGIPKYFQLARCFRDEDLRADRQPEFTQLDMEMSFAADKTIQDIAENMLRRLWKELLDVELSSKFQRLSYNDAMARYGSDKPDIRLGMEISQIEHMLPLDLINKISTVSDPVVDAMKLQVSSDASNTRTFIAEFMETPEATVFITNPDGQPGIFVFDTHKLLQGLQPFGFEVAERLQEIFQLQDGDLVIIQARKSLPFSGGSTTMGNLRSALHKAAVTKGLVAKPTGFEFLWIVDFPLFSPSSHTEPGQSGVAGLAATHHPFTAPSTVEDVDLLSSDPASARAGHYDIVANGVELGGGSVRIHDSRVQEFIMRDVLKMSEERLEDFRHLLNALRAGCPPHAGIALGFDRLIALMLGRESVRDVIAFPKNGKGEDLLAKAPNVVTKEQLETYHLALKA